MNQYRCETCNRVIGVSNGTNDCPHSVPSHLDDPIVDCMEVVGCASHSDFQNQKENDCPKFKSSDLLLLANDEWKRREERKHNHEHICWTAGFINGFLTDKKWARKYIDKLMQVKK